jgi:hypothetical protein
MNDQDSESKAKAYALNVLEMVAVLHRRGYEQLRIVPGMAPSGMYWRCAVTHTGNITPEHGALSIEFWEESAHYTSGSANGYFDWEDAKDDGPEQLADRFLERQPEICEKGLAADPEYVAWYMVMLELAIAGEFPVAYDEFWEELDPRWLPITEGIKSGLPMPPLQPTSLNRDINPHDHRRPV